MGRKEILTQKKKKLITELSGWVASSYISSQILPEKGNSGIHYFISKHNCYFEPFKYVMGEWAVLDLSSILFIKSELV